MKDAGSSEIGGHGGGYFQGDYSDFAPLARVGTQLASEGFILEVAMPYLAIPIMFFETVLLVGGAALIGDAGRRLLRGQKK